MAMNATLRSADDAELAGCLARPLDAEQRQINVNHSCLELISVIRGIMVYGAVMMGQGPDDPVPVTTNDPVYLSAEYIESGIANGTLQAGCLNNVTVQPPVEAWPPEWRVLKE